MLFFRVNIFCQLLVEFQCSECQMMMILQALLLCLAGFALSDACTDGWAACNVTTTLLEGNLTECAQNAGWLLSNLTECNETSVLLYGNLTECNDTVIAMAEQIVLLRAYATRKRVAEVYYILGIILLSVLSIVLFFVTLGCGMALYGKVQRDYRRLVGTFEQG